LEHSYAWKRIHSVRQGRRRRRRPGRVAADRPLGKDGWIEIGDWTLDVEAEASHLKGTGAAVGKPTSGVLSFSHFYDKSSPS
jgi:type VI secretion system secreted protein Hcp